MRRLGVKYTDEEINQSEQMLVNKTEMDALIYYLQSLGIHRQ